MIAALAFRGNINAGVLARAVIEPWTISLAAIALWWWVPSDGLLVSYALSMGAALLFSAIPFFRDFGLPKAWKPRPIELYALARLNAPLVAADAIEWGSRRLDVFILGFFVSPATIGIYWVAQQLASLPQKLKTSFDPVLVPAITRKLKEGDTAGVALQISQVGFWVIAAQLGVALALGIPGEALMAAIGPKRDFVGGNGALAFLLTAEVVAAAAVVSEAALIYIARHRNMALSLGMIGLQAALTIGLIMMLEVKGYPELWQAAAAAASLAVSLLAGSILKTRLAARLLAAPVSIWRWQLVPAALIAGLVGGVATSGPQWSELLIGIPAILGIYGWIIWRFAFRAEDRILFKKG
jgi:O-antigen/teichoic acid export membrane protein